MSETDWKAIAGKLQAAGFAVCYARVSYEPKNPLWRATARRDLREWSCLGRDLETALAELEKQTQEHAIDWRAMLAREKCMNLDPLHGLFVGT